MRVCITCGKRPAQTSGDACLVCMWDAINNQPRDSQPRPTPLSVTLTLTPCQFFYLRDAVTRDLENLEEMAPWDIDDQVDEHADEVRMCKGMIALLGKVEQSQVIPH